MKRIQAIQEATKNAAIANKPMTDAFKVVCGEHQKLSKSMRNYLETISKELWLLEREMGAYTKTNDHKAMEIKHRLFAVEERLKRVISY